LLQDRQFLSTGQDSENPISNQHIPQVQPTGEQADIIHFICGLDFIIFLHKNSISLTFKCLIFGQPDPNKVKLRLTAGRKATDLSKDCRVAD
jgi:hypothetical protein